MLFQTLFILSSFFRFLYVSLNQFFIVIPLAVHYLYPFTSSFFSYPLIWPPLFIPIIFLIVFLYLQSCFLKLFPFSHFRCKTSCTLKLSFLINLTLNIVFLCLCPRLFTFYAHLISALVLLLKIITKI